MHFAHSARKVMLDTSPFRRFLDVDLFLELHGYLGKRAFVVAEVMAELCDVAGYRRHAALKMTLSATPPWPQVTPPPPLDVEEEILRIQSEMRPAMLAVEMTLHGALDDGQGFAVYDCATPAGVGQSEFKAAIARARNSSP